MKTEVASAGLGHSQAGPASRLWGILRRAPKLPALIILVFILMAVFADVIASQSPTAQNIPGRLQPPFWMPGGSAAHPLGTDTLGRDQLTRLIFGVRITLVVAVLALLLGGITGLLVGVVAGYFGQWYDLVFMRITDSAMAIPSIFLGLLFAVTMGASFYSVILAIGLVIWSHFVRVIRGETLRIKEADFVKLARVAGCSDTSILLHHVLPNLVNTWVILLSLELGAVIIIEAILSFLGAGVPPPNPSWGSMVSDGREYVASNWWLSFFPGMAITLLVLSVNMLGDWLRDMLDPKIRQQAR